MEKDNNKRKQFDKSLFKDFFGENPVHQILNLTESKRNNTEYVRKIEEFSIALIENCLTATQLRNIFNEVKLIQQKKDYDNLISLKIQLAYISARNMDKIKDEDKGKQNKKRIFIENFFLLLMELVEKINENQSSINEFVKFLEGIIAYHKFYSVKIKEEKK